MPRQTIFFDLLKEVDDVSIEMAALLVEFARKFNNFEDYYNRARDLEHKADDKSHEIIDRLNRTFITPFDREDIYLLAHEMDEILDLIEKVIHDVYIYNIPTKFEFFDQFVDLIAKCSSYMKELLLCLQEMKANSRLSKAKIKIHELEDEADALFNDSIAKLFREEKDPIRIIKLKDILESLENVVDQYQKVSNIIEGIIVKSS